MTTTTPVQVALQIQRAARIVAARMEHNGPCTIRQYEILTLVNERERCIQSDIYKRMLVAPTVITQMVDRMERAGLIERRPDATDRRANVLRITSKGHEVLAQSTKVIVEGLPFAPDDLAALSIGLDCVTADGHEMVTDPS